MDSELSSQGKAFPGRTASLGLLALGIGLILWAWANIATQTPQIAEAPRPASLAATVTVVDSRPATTSSAPEVLYAENPAIGDTLGTLSIPVLELELPILQGTEADQLEKGIGHVVESVLPGLPDNCVISAHRDTYFARLGELEIGDRMTVHTAAGTFTYAIKQIRIVDKDDRTVIVPTDHAVLTVTTCYPFNYVGPAPDRYVLVADIEK